MKKTILVLSVLLAAIPVFADIEADITALRDGVGARRDTVLQSLIDKPWPGDISIISCFYKNVNIAEANAAIIEEFHTLLPQPGDPGYGDSSPWGDFKGDFAWGSHELYKIYRYFGSNGSKNPGLLTQDSCDAIFELFWQWSKSRSKLSVVNDMMARNTWKMYGSENIDMMQKTTFYCTAEILRELPAYKDRLYDDGGTVEEHYQAWNTLIKKHLRERAKKTLTLEVGAHGYGKYLTQCWYNLYDCALDAELAKLSGMMLDIFWTEWAQEQFDGVRGGGKNRIYQEAALGDETRAMAWVYFNCGVYSKHPAMLCLMTSSYIPPEVVYNIALDIDGRGTYECISRKHGLWDPDEVPDGFNYFREDFGGILRYTYVTPDYIIGSMMFENLDHADWVALSDQNRFQSVIFPDDPTAIIYPQCVGLNNGKTYNQYWSAQKHGTLITQKLTGSTQSGDMRVCFSKGTDMSVTQEGSWIFARLDNSYAAVRPAWGTYSWDDSNWIKFSDDFAPVIIDVVQAKDHTFEEFKTAVIANSITVESGVLSYTGISGGDEFTFYCNDQDLIHKINGLAIDLAPDFTFKSPFMNEQYDSGVITIEKGSRKTVYDFNTALKGY